MDTYGTSDACSGTSSMFWMSHLLCQSLAEHCRLPSSHVGAYTVSINFMIFCLLQRNSYTTSHRRTAHITSLKHTRPPNKDIKGSHGNHGRTCPEPSPHHASASALVPFPMQPRCTTYLNLKARTLPIGHTSSNHRSRTLPDHHLHILWLPRRRSAPPAPSSHVPSHGQTRLRWCF
jgi:hypothetical protein